MSNRSLPVHLSCFGVHADVVSSIRSDQYAAAPRATPTYSQRLAATKSSMQAAKSDVVAATVYKGAATPAPPPGTGNRQATGYSASQPMGTPVASDTYYQAMTTSTTAKAAKHTRSRPAASSEAVQVSQQHTFIVPIHMDFQAIADASVGGGGLPRPYGRFTAARQGDGTAMWERLPPKHRGDQIDLTPSSPDRSDRVKASCDAAPLPRLPISRAHRLFMPSYKMEKLNIIRRIGLRTDSHVDGASATSVRHSRPELPSYEPLSAPASLAASLRNPTSLAAALHNRPSLPPTPSALHLPAATFLSEVPRVPTFLRVECGHAASREHLRSGLQSALFSPAEAELASPYSAAAREHLCSSLQAGELSQAGTDLAFPFSPAVTVAPEEGSSRGFPLSPCSVRGRSSSRAMDTASSRRSFPSSPSRANRSPDRSPDRSPSFFMTSNPEPSIPLEHSTTQLTPAGARAWTGQSRVTLKLDLGDWSDNDSATGHSPLSKRGGSQGSTSTQSRGAISPSKSVRMGVASRGDGMLHDRRSHHAPPLSEGLEPVSPYPPVDLLLKAISDSQAPPRRPPGVAPVLATSARSMRTSRASSRKDPEERDMDEM